MKKFGFSIGFIVAVFLVMLYYIFFVDDPVLLYGALSSAKIWPLIVAFLLMVLYWIFETLAQYFVFKSGGSKLSFFKVLRVTMVGQLFNCITPSASGGQPMQIYEMTRYGVSAGNGTCMLLVRFLIYQLIMVLYSGVMLILKLSYFNSQISAFSSLALVGFLVNFGVLIGLILACFFPQFAVKISAVVFNFLHKIKLCKNSQKKIEKVTEEVKKFNDSFNFYKGNLKVSVLPALSSLLQLTVFFLVPYFVALSLGVKMPLDIAFAAASLVFMICSFVPLPGGSGGAEGAFLLLFGGAFAVANKSVAVAILLWRVFTFYLPILVGTVFFVSKRKGKFKDGQNQC